jgi:hypothetical protein
MAEQGAISFPTFGLVLLATLLIKAKAFASCIAYV